MRVRGVLFRHDVICCMQASEKMADESAALDALYKAANNLVDCKAKLTKEAVDTFAEVHPRADHPLHQHRGPACSCLGFQNGAASSRSAAVCHHALSYRPACCTAPFLPVQPVSLHTPSSFSWRISSSSCRLQHAADFQALLDNAKVGPKCKTLALQVHRSTRPSTFGIAFTLETTQGQIDGFCSQLPFKYYLPEVESMGE